MKEALNFFGMIGRCIGRCKDFSEQNGIDFAEVIQEMQKNLRDSFDSNLTLEEYYNISWSKTENHFNAMRNDND